MANYPYIPGNGGGGPVDEEERPDYRMPLSDAASYVNDNTNVDHPVIGDSGVSYERPSFGARIGARQPSYMPKAAAPQQAENVQPPSEPIQLDPSKMPDLMGGPRMPPAAPVGSNNPNLVDLLKQRGQVGTAIDPRIPGTSHTQPKYKMGLGQRILGTLSNAATGFAGRGGDPVYVGPGATNRQFSMDEAARQSKVSNLDTQIKGQEQLDTENIRRETELRKAMYDAMVGGARQTTANAQETRAGAYANTVAPAIAAKDTAQATQANAAANQKDATRPRQQMGDRMMEKQDDGTWKDVGPAPKKQFAPPKGGGKDGKLPTARDFDKVEKDKNAAMAKAEQDASKSLKTALTEEEKQEIYGELEKKKATIQTEYQGRITNLNKTPTPASPASRTPAKPGAQAKAFQAPAGAPAAPKEDGHKLKMNGQIIAISKGGQWTAPQ